MSLWCVACLGFTFFRIRTLTVREPSPACGPRSFADLAGYVDERNTATVGEQIRSTPVAAASHPG